ncbi:MAG: transposase [Elusimicrobiota bacterium]|nr:transposase [Elusimicrobiota bacterium]
MARPLRIEYPGAVYHITSRGNRRGGIFLDDKDRKVFLAVFEETIRRFNASCHAYCLMSNHYHLVIETAESNLSRVMRHLNGVYTQIFNRKHRKCGHLLQGRYTAIVIEKSSYLLEASRYVVLNPVRAGIVDAPGDWEWSSYNAMAGLAEKPEFLTTRWLLEQFGEDMPGARVRYVEFVEDGRGSKLWNDLTHGVVLGSEDFAGRCRLLAHGEGDLSEIPKEQRYADRPGLSAILNGPGLNSGKWMIAVDRFGYTQKEVASLMGMHYSYISRVLTRERSKVKT